MSKERNKIIQALENMSITFDELGFAPTTLTNKKCEHFGDWFKYEIATIKAVSKKQDEQLALTEKALELACDACYGYTDDLMTIETRKNYFKTKAKEIMDSE